MERYLDGCHVVQILGPVMSIVDGNLLVDIVGMLIWNEGVSFRSLCR